jgi:phage gpG-like protein
LNIKLNIKVASVQAMLKGLDERLDLRGPLGHAIAEIMRDDALSQFQASGIPAWAPLAPSTIAQKAGQGYPRLSRSGLSPTSLMQLGAFGPQNILERTGALLSSWTSGSDPDHIEVLERDSVWIGSSKFYAEFHQSDAPRKKLPRRPIVVTDQARERIARTIERYALQGDQ